MNIQTSLGLVILAGLAACGNGGPVSVEGTDMFASFQAPGG